MDVDSASTSGSCRQLDGWLKSFQPSGGKHAHLCFRHAGTKPPITVDSLRELDLSHIAVNAKLRHDINFERELHFRPNVDGSRGKHKQQVAQDYWMAVEAELEFYAFMRLHPDGERYRHTAAWSEHFQQGQRRVPEMLAAIRDVTISLVPETERSQILDVMDGSLIKQQIEKGVFDLAGIVEWFGALLKGHCAPMRDQWVDRMLHKMRACDAGREAQAIVETMKDLFGILEAMRLDVANHQIRYCRPSLLESTFDFETRYFQRKFQTGQMDLHQVRSWYNSAVDTYCRENKLESSDAGNRFAAFTSAWTYGAFHTAERPPETFKLDLERIGTLREDFRNLMYKHVCWIAFCMVVREADSTMDADDSTIETVMSHVGSIIGQSPSEARWQASLGHLAVEITRLAVEYVSRSGVKGEHSFSELAEGVEAWLQRSLTCKSPSYQEAAAALTNTILRYTVEASMELLTSAPSEIFAALADAPNAVKSRTEQAWIDRYFARSGKTVRCLETSGCCHRTQAIIRKATQINLLHWRVFSPLVYEADENALQLISGVPSRPLSTTSLESQMFAFSVADRRESSSSSVASSPSDPPK